MNDYELVTILHPDIKDEDVGDTVERLNQFITGRGGEVHEVDQWGRRRLAYPIARQFEGTYIVSHVQMQPANAAELEANLRISEEVLRHLLVRYSPAERAAALAAMQRRRPRPAFDEQGGAAAPAATDEQPATAGVVLAEPDEASVSEASSGSAGDGAPAEPATAEAEAVATQPATEATAAVEPEAPAPEQSDAEPASEPEAQDDSPQPSA